MDFNLDENQTMLKNMAREFATKELEPLAPEIDESGEFPHASIKKMS